MKKKTIRLLSVLLTICLLVGCTGITAFAAKQNDKQVLVFVNGMGVFPLMENAGTPEEKQAFPPETDEIVEMVAKIAPPLLQYFADKDADKLSDNMLPPIKELFDKVSLNPDGTTKYNVTAPKLDGNISNHPEFINESATKCEYAIVRRAAEIFGAENVYDFNYDWRLDPMEHAKDLHETIKQAKEETGVDKVILACGSMGGTVTSSYLAMYGSDDISHLVMLSAAFNGVSILGELFCGNLQIDGTSLIETVSQNDMDEQLALFLKILFTALDNAGVLDGLIDVVDDYLLTQKDRLFDEVIHDTFGSITSFWDMVPLSYYEEAKGYMLDEVKDAQLIKRSDNYHYNVQAKFPENVKKAQEKGMMFSVVSHYDMQVPPVSPSYRNQSDNLIDTVYTSGFAVCAPLGETLPEDYKAENPVCTEHCHISADRVIDASTCISPEQTWFLKNLDHMGYRYGADTMDFVMYLLTSKTQPTVWDNEKYPQFMETNVKDGKITPIGTLELPTEETTTEIPTKTETTLPEKTTVTESATETLTENETAEITEREETPDTGESSLIGAVLLLSVCAAGTGILTYRRKRK